RRASRGRSARSWYRRRSLLRRRRTTTRARKRSPSAGHARGELRLPLLERLHGLLPRTERENCVAGGARGGHRGRVRDAIRDGALPQRVVVRLRVLAERRVDEELDVT